MEPLPAATAAGLRWLGSGAAGFSAMLAAIAAARESVQLETYIFHDSPVGRRIGAALLAACKRGVRVRVLIDGFGSYSLPAYFWRELQESGGECRIFNPLHVRRFPYRNHRKSLSCDDRLAIIGGFNIASEYDGDGVHSGWRDLGLEFTGPLALHLARSFDALWSAAGERPQRFARLRRTSQRRRIVAEPGELLFSGPGRGSNPLKQAWLRDLNRAQDVQIVSAYFLPTWRLRRQLMRIARHGGRVQLLLPAHSDVPMAQRAARSLYSRLLRAGVEIWEYQPQILHAKLMIIDDAAYVGSANFNTRSLHIDYELMLRLSDSAAVSQARAIFAGDLAHALPVDRDEWRQSRSSWEGLQQRIAYWLMARLDPLAARWLWDRLS